MKRKIFRAEVLGFCMGVRRAMKKVEEAVERNDAGRISTFGPLIHNRQAVEELKEKGVKRIDSPDEFSDGSVVIRAHGVPKNTVEELTRCGAAVIDGTCPRVMRSMKLVQRYAQLGWNIVLVGDPGHGEVKAVAAYAETTQVVSSPEEAEALSLDGPTMVIAQTTVTADEYRRIVEMIEKKDIELELIDSICTATKERQQALRELAERVDAIVIIGGFDSSNTKRLHQLALSFGKPSWHIELPQQLPPEVKNYRTIGISAGASTPDRIIDEVEHYLQNLE
jgi:4-hydroxy-3-methylbut-2-en-1-yl diphosphate reductase